MGFWFKIKDICIEVEEYVKKLKENKNINFIHVKISNNSIHVLHNDVDNLSHNIVEKIFEINY